jgi:hypothetical protein
MLTLGGLCLGSLWTRAGSPQGKAVLVTSTAALYAFVSMNSGLTISPFSSKELVLLEKVSGISMRSFVSHYLAAVFTVSTLVAALLTRVGLSIESQRPELGQLVQAKSLFRGLLALSTNLLVCGVIGMNLLHRWAQAAAVGETAVAIKTVGPAVTITSGVFYSMILAAVFIPPELLLRRAARASTAKLQLVEGEPRESWLTKQGFDLSVPHVLMRVAAIMAPLLASVLQDFAKLT